MEVCLAVGAAADELVDPEVLPTLFAVDPADTADLLGVSRSVRARLQQALGTLPVAETMACAPGRSRVEHRRAAADRGAGWPLSPLSYAEVLTDLAFTELVNRCNAGCSRHRC